MAKRDFFDPRKGERRGDPPCYRITASGLDWLAERERARARVEAFPSRRCGPKAVEPHPLADAITANVARLAAERGLAASVAVAVGTGLAG